MAPSAPRTASSFGITKPGVGRQVQLVDARDDLVAQLRIEVDAVGVEQLGGRRIVALGLDALHFGEQPADALAKRRRIHHHEERLAVALTALDGLGVGDEPVDDHLAHAHVRLLDLRAGRGRAGAAQRVARVALRTPHARCPPGRPPAQAELRGFWIGDEVQPNQIGPRFLERREVLLDGTPRACRSDAVRELARRVADRLVHVGRDLAGQGAPLFGAG